MTNNLFNKEYKNKIRLIIFTIIIYFLFLLGFVIIRYNITIRSIYKEIDSKLYKSADSLNIILTEDFFNRALKSDSINSNEDYENIIKLSKFCKIMNIKYVYSMILVENEIYFTSSSATDDELANGNYTKYFDRYDEATSKNKLIFYNNIPLYEESKDKWGTFRSVLIPKKTAKGIKYIVGADYSLNKLNLQLIESMIQSILIGIFFLFIISPLLGVSYFYIKKETENVVNKSLLDELTELPNLQKMFIDISRLNNPVLFILNINSFKEINDLFGFQIGDIMLKEIANRIQFILISDKYRLYKLLNDEFGIIIDDEELSKENIEVVAKYIFDAVSDYTYIIRDIQINITIYIGVAISKILNLKMSDDAAHNLYAFADMALKLAKQKEREFIIFDENLNKSEEFKKNLEWSFRLKDALKNDRFVPFFQPIVNNKNGKIEKYECLIRLIENDKVISPYYFLNVSKKIKLYSTLTRIMMKKSCDIFKNTDYEFSINVSSYDIYDKETYLRIIFLLEEYSNISKNIVFEIIESEGIENYEVVKKFIDEIKNFGCKIAIDDFGTGYSNFEHILKLNVDYLKIDGSLIKNIDENKNNYFIVKSITDFAKALNIKTIAEFVHNKAVYNKILGLGIDYSQGYYFGDPSPDIKK